MLGRGKAAAAKMAKAMIFSNSHKEFAVGQGSWTDDGNTTNWIGVYTRSKDRRKCFSCFTTFHVCGNSFPAKLMGWGPVTDHWSSGQDSAISLPKTWVQSLVVELRPHRLCSEAK